MSSKNCIIVVFLLILFSLRMGKLVGGSSGAPGVEVIGSLAAALNYSTSYPL